MNRKFLAFSFLFLLTFLWVVSTSKAGQQVEGCLEGCASRSTEGDGLVRVISLNMLHGFPRFQHLDRRLELIVDQIEQLDPDIVLLQEVPWTLKRGSTAQALAKQTGMNYAYLRANGNRWALAFEEGEAILSRYPLSEPSFVQLKPRSGLFEHRVVLHLVARTELGEVGLFVTHLTHDDDRVNQGQAESLSSFIGVPQEVFSIVAGDFNALPDSPQISGLPADWMDPFDGSTFAVDSYTCCIDILTQQSARLTKRIDYLFVIPGSLTPQVISANRVFDTPFLTDEGWFWASDHVGLVADFGAYP